MGNYSIKIYIYENDIDYCNFLIRDRATIADDRAITVTPKGQTMLKIILNDELLCNSANLLPLEGSELVFACQ